MCPGRRKKFGFKILFSLLAENTISAIKTPSEMEVAPRYTLLTVFTLFVLFKRLYTAETVAVFLYILLGRVREYLVEITIDKQSKDYSSRRVTLAER